MEGEIIRDLSSPYTTNRVYLLHNEKHGNMIKKEFGQSSHFKRAVEAIKVVDRSLHPAIYKIDMRRQHLYMSYNPIQTLPESMDACVADLMKKLHESTVRYSGVRDPGTGQTFSTWKDFLQQRGAAAVETIKNIRKYGSQFEERMNRLNDSPFSPVSYIHRDIRPDNIGERKGEYLLLDFELAMIGDPHWDVARYAFQSAESKDDFCGLYGVKDMEKLDVYIWLLALDFAAYLFRHDGTENPEFERCLAQLDKS